MKHYLPNMVANIKNGLAAKRKIVYQVREKKCEAILQVLWNEGFILGYTISPNKEIKGEEILKIYLKYNNGKPVINNIKLISKPGHKLYYSIKQIWKIPSNNSLIIFNTTRGLKSLLDCKKLNIGGEPWILIN